MTIGSRLKLLRDTLDLSMASFGEKIKMTSSNISKMEKDLRVVTDRTIALISNEFGVNEQWLRTGEGDMFIAVTEDEKFAELLGELLVNENNELVKEIITKVVELDDDYLLLIEQLIDGLLKKQSQET
ncbi:helix-turn-helix domain-containing protein [Lysinibacillus varians]|uniref:Helix-turn-helix transcriptional regulator n=1 Tax=Lysinibacillus varians TaxID=1145276 RepID=A0ABY2T7S4_9BACI|nr:helix-turn-helix transcriptional regulator [Lysinibacillus varians]TKI60484.1 helix-turn-helix transcriptional regulator [Lysinibacillus varians]